MKYLFIYFLIATSLASPAQSKKLSFTFDDGSLGDRPGYEFEEWNGMLLDNLDKANVKAIFFVKADDKESEKGRYLLSSWNDKGHKIANHTYSHPNFNRENVSFENFKEELLRADSVIRAYSNYVKIFRFPYLKEGNTKFKVDSIRGFLKARGYVNGHVTIDASDWYIDSRLIKRLKEDPNAELEEFKKFYLEHIYERATYYEELSFKLTNRHIHHTLLLHHNLTAALFLGDLVEMFREKGWEIVSADKAYEDPVFAELPEHAGESLIWALAKDSGKYDPELRYPAEDSSYEKDRMDKLGL